jgi:uncharacterized protein YigE (DUF2233 family)
LAVFAVVVMVAASGWWGISRQRELPAACSDRMFEGASFVVCVYDRKRHELQLVLEGSGGVPLRRLPAIRSQVTATAVRFAMNAGMFDAAGYPIGLYVEDGVERQELNTKPGEGNFHLLPNGVFWVSEDGAPRVETTSSYLRRAAVPRWATQSGPMLVIDGELHPRIAEDGDSRHVRNAVGVDSHGHAVFVISQDPVSFGRIARFFRDDLGCQNALYLDGAVSSLWRPDAARLDDVHDLGPMIDVTTSPEDR